jgi:hypothetical protein
MDFLGTCRKVKVGQIFEKTGKIVRFLTDLGVFGGLRALVGYTRGLFFAFLTKNSVFFVVFCDIFH